MVNHYFNGKLSLEESIDKMNYIITDLVDKEQKSITNLLDKIYNSNICKKLIDVELIIYNNSHNKKAFGSLNIQKDRFGTFGYHVSDYQLELQLYELVGNDISLSIDDYTNASAEDGTEHEYDTRIL